MGSCQNSISNEFLSPSFKNPCSHFEMICDLFVYVIYFFFFFLILGWVFLSVQLRHQQKSSQQEHLPSNEPPHQTADRGGKERRVTVKMTSLGVCWDTGPLSSILSPPSSPYLGPFLQHYHHSGHLWLPTTHTLTLSTCSRNTRLTQPLSCLEDLRFEFSMYLYGSLHHLGILLPEPSRTVVGAACKRGHGKVGAGFAIRSKP